MKLKRLEMELLFINRPTSMLSLFQEYGYANGFTVL